MVITRGLPRCLGLAVRTVEQLLRVSQSEINSHRSPYRTIRSLKEESNTTPRSTKRAPTRLNVSAMSSRVLCQTLMIFLVVIGFAISSDAEEKSADKTPPNIVLLLADDLGWTGLGCFGSDFYETPNLDRLAETGMKFTNAYAACTVCSPTRASLMTGMYPARLHLTDFIAGQNRPHAKLKIPDWTKQLEHSHTTLAEALGDAGYTTAQIGKWHLARNARDPAENPTAHGFDIQHLKPKGTKGYMLPKDFNREGESKSDYLTDYLTDKALEVIDQNQNKPFFLYFAYHTPHTPIQGRTDIVEQYQAKVNPDSLHKNPSYAAMVHSLDQSVGRILDRLRKHKIDQQTIVLFISDNGGLTQRYGKLDNFTDNAPLRRGKGSAYEGGVRVPAIMHWPGVTKPGSICDEPIMTIDFYPTILSLANATGDNTHNSDIDGVSLVPLLRNSNSVLGRDLFWHYPHYHAGGDSPYSAVRSGDWRLIHFHEDDSLRLYDLKQDLSEKTDQSKLMPKKTEELREKLFAWRAEVNAQMPTLNSNYDPQRATQTGSKKKPR